MAAKPKRSGGLVGSKRPKAGEAGIQDALDRRDKAEKEDKRPDRQKATFELSPALLAELRVASAVSGETLVTLVQEGLEAALQRLREEFMGGKPFPLQVKTRKGRPQEE